MEEVKINKSSSLLWVKPRVWEVYANQPMLVAHYTAIAWLYFWALGLLSLLQGSFVLSLYLLFVFQQVLPLGVDVLPSPTIPLTFVWMTPQIQCQGTELSTSCGSWPFFGTSLGMALELFPLKYADLFVSVPDTLEVPRLWFCTLGRSKGLCSWRVNYCFA